MIIYSVVHSIGVLFIIVHMHVCTRVWPKWLLLLIVALYLISSFHR